MKIDDYILRGGENLNAAARKTPNFPIEAERVFKRLYETLGEDINERENYLELPVDRENRLFIRSFWVEARGNRPICYYAGLVVPKELYCEAGEYYRLHKGLVQITIADILAAAKHGFESLECVTDWSLPRTAIGLEFEELAHMKLYGEKEYDANLNRMRLSLSINNIDDWFCRLVIAVNPSRQDAAYHIVISKKKPRQTISENYRTPSDFYRHESFSESQSKIQPEKTQPLRSHDEFRTETKKLAPTDSCSGRTRGFMMKNLVGIVIVILLCLILLRQTTVQSSRIDELKNKITNLEEQIKYFQSIKVEGEIKTLKDEVETLKTEITDLKDEVETWKTEITDLKDEVETWKTEITDLKKKVEDWKDEIKKLNLESRKLKK